MNKREKGILIASAQTGNGALNFSAIKFMRKKVKFKLPFKNWQTFCFVSQNIHLKKGP